MSFPHLLAYGVKHFHSIICQIFKYMLAYIRNNVRTSFDKLFEDAIGFFYAESGIDESDRYHTLLTFYNYEFDRFTDEYRENVGIKQENLAKLELEYAKLPK